MDRFKSLLYDVHDIFIALKPFIGKGQKQEYTPNSIMWIKETRYNLSFNVLIKMGLS